MSDPVSLLRWLRKNERKHLARAKRLRREQREIVSPLFGALGFSVREIAGMKSAERIRTFLRIAKQIRLICKAQDRAVAAEATGIKTHAVKRRRPRSGGRTGHRLVTEHDKEIVRLYATRARLSTVAKKLGMSLSWLKSRIKQLVATGTLDPKSRPAKRRKKKINIAKGHAAMIVRMKRLGATEQEIAEQSGVTRQRVQQIAARIVRDHGATLLTPR